MSGIFLSYRRDDASGWAGRIYEHLAREWGAEHVFMDIDTIAPGEDFREAIERTMQVCDVVLVVVGPSWLNARDQAGNRRLDDDHDTHRAEVVAALAADVRVVPVLVGGAQMPRASELPEAIKDLTYRNAAVIEDRRFASDVDALKRTLRPLVGGTPPGAQGQPSPRPARAPSTAGFGALGREGVVALIGTGLVVIWGPFAERWHDEAIWLLLLATLGLLAGVGYGLWAKRWTWVFAAGAGALAAAVVWLLWILGTHGAELGEVLSPAYDGIENTIVLSGAAMVLAAGISGRRREAAARPS